MGRENSFKNLQTRLNEQTNLCKLLSETSHYKFQKPYVPVYDKTKKEIISTLAGKSVGMTNINHGHNIVS